MRGKGVDAPAFQSSHMEIVPEVCTLMLFTWQLVVTHCGICSGFARCCDLFDGGSCAA